MKFLPAIFIILSFVTICIGAYLKSEHYPGANFILLSGLVGEGVFILLNRMMYSRKRE